MTFEVQARRAEWRLIRANRRARGYALPVGRPRLPRVDPQCRICPFVSLVKCRFSAVGCGNLVRISGAATLGTSDPMPDHPLGGDRGCEY